MWKVTTIFFMVLSLLLAAAIIVPHRPSTRAFSNMELFRTPMVAQASDGLLKMTKAKVLVFWSADLQINSRTVLYMHDDHGTVNELIGYTDQIYSGNQAMNVFMTQLMIGKLNCGQVNTASKVGQYVAAIGAPSICRRGIIKDGILVGYISLSYPAVPSDAEVERADKVLDSFVPSVFKS